MKLTYMSFAKKPILFPATTLEVGLVSKIKRFFLSILRLKDSKLATKIAGNAHRLSAVGSATYFILCYLYITFHQLAYPFELEWVEGGYLPQIARILTGNKIYAPPSINFLPFIYTPLYPYLAALLAKFTGISFLSLRLVSFLSILGCFFFIFDIVKKQTGDIYASLIALGLFSATYPLTGAWFNIGRVDSLFLFFILAAYWVALNQRKGYSVYLISLLLLASFYTKQAGLVMLIFAGGIFLKKKTTAQLLRYIAFSTITFLVINFSLDVVHNGWFSYYVFQLAGNHIAHWQISQQSLVFWFYDIAAHFQIALFLTGIYLFNQKVPKLRRENNKFLNICFAAGMISISWEGRINAGGFDNVLLPGFAALAILFGLGWKTVWNWAHTNNNNRFTRLRKWIVLGMLLQFFALVYPIGLYLPNAKHEQMNEEILSILDQIKEPVLIPFDNYLPMLLGKDSYLHLGTLVSPGDVTASEKITAEIHSSLTRGTFGAIIMDGDFFDIPSPPYIRFRMSSCLNVIHKALIGWEVTPEFIYLLPEYADRVNEICPALNSSGK